VHRKISSANKMTPRNADEADSSQTTTMSVQC